MDAGIMALMIPFAGMGMVAYMVYLAHVRKLAEIKAHSGNVVVEGGTVSADVRTELQALRAEVEKLRDTSTKFDMSFDAGLTRLEERVSRVEETRAVAPSQYRVSTSTRDEELQTVSAGSGTGR